MTLVSDGLERSLPMEQYSQLANMIEPEETLLSTFEGLNRRADMFLRPVKLKRRLGEFQMNLSSIDLG